MRPAPVWPEDQVAVVILTGGRSRRMGRDKARLPIGGVPLLERLLQHVPRAVPVVVVGPGAGTSRQVSAVTEDPPGGGPAAGLAIT